MDDNFILCVSKCICGLKSALETNVLSMTYQRLFAKFRTMIFLKKKNIARPQWSVH